jgi:hypothetical protein
MFPLIALGLLAATFIGLMIARKIREDRDAERTEATGGRWRIRSQILVPAPDPYARFGFLTWHMILNTREGTDEGFEVAYFDACPRVRGRREHCAIGPTMSDALASMMGMDVKSEPFTILVYSLNRPRTLKTPPSASPTPSSPTRRPRADRIDFCDVTVAVAVPPRLPLK